MGRKSTTTSKHSVLRDELKLKKGGLYAIFPWASTDKSGKGLFKIGMAVSPLHKRMDDYHNMFPFAVNMIAFIEDPPVTTMGTRNRPDAKSKQSKYLEIEKFIFNFVSNNGGQRFYSFSRVKGQRKKLEDASGNRMIDKGETEWFYTDQLLIHEAFSEANKVFGGRLELYDMTIDENTDKPINLQKEAAKAKQVKPNFVGEIIYPLE